MMKELKPSLLCAAHRMFAANFYVAPAGNGNNAGTMARPFAIVQIARFAASPGDAVYLRSDRKTNYYKTINQW